MRRKTIIFSLVTFITLFLALTVNARKKKILLTAFQVQNIVRYMGIVIESSIQNVHMGKVMDHKRANRWGLPNSKNGHKIKIAVKQMPRNVRGGRIRVRIMNMVTKKIHDKYL